MAIEADREWDLAMDPATVRLFILKARAISADLPDDYEAGHEHEIELDERATDLHQHDGLAEEEEENLTGQELRALIDDLNIDEAAALVALMWVGRGDYEAAEWAEAVAEAKLRDRRRTAKYLLGFPMLGDWLEEGLEVLGCDRR